MSRKPTIAYVAQFFPYLTETFVYREVCALRDSGFNVVTFSNRTPDPEKLSEESRGLVGSTTYVFPVDWLPVLLAHLYFLLRHPIRYISTAKYVLAVPGESMSNRKRTVGHFFGAVYLAREAQKKGVEHIHAHFAVNAATIGLVMSRLINVTYSFTAHNIFFTDKLILRQKLESATFIPIISDFSRQYLLDYAPDLEGLDDKFHIVRCGISPNDFTPKPYLNGSKPPTPQIFSLARMDEKKGMPYLVEACRILRDRGVDFHCVIGGPGEEKPLVEQLVKKYDLSNHIETPGVLFQDQITPYWDKADMFVLACVTAKDGDQDGIPVVLMESMAKCVPSISTYVSGVPELIDDQETGLLVPEKDAEALADAMQKLIDDPAYAVNMGLAGRAKVSSEFNVYNSADKLAKLFQHYIR